MRDAGDLQDHRPEEEEEFLLSTWRSGSGEGSAAAGGPDSLQTQTLLLLLTFDLRLVF